MTEDDIPTFIGKLIDLGCEPVAIGSASYVIGDADLPEFQLASIQARLDDICDLYSDRGKLQLQIVAYLHSIGRSYPAPTQH